MPRYLLNQGCYIRQNKITTMDTKDSNGNILTDGDTVHVTKDLKVKGMSAALKRGKPIRNIRLTNSPQEIEVRAGKSTIVIKTQFVKKA